jgi:hypothetical protein
MGYNTSATTITLTAKLTPTGRKKLILTNNNLVSSFSLGDSDANYNAALPLLTGEVPGDGGNIGTYSSQTNSVAPNVSMKSILLVNNTGITKKDVEIQSSEVVINTIANGLTSVDTTFLTQNVVDRNNTSTDSLVNLYYSFNLPVSSNDDYKFTGLTSSQGGFSDTALSGLAQTKIIVIGVDNTKYGELIDGKTIKVELTTSASTYTIYSTYQNTGQPQSVLDGTYSDPSENTKFLGDNISLLFSDGIKKPSGDALLSWSTGWSTVKPFAVNGKQPYNLVTDTNISEYVDESVGVAYLDKGFIVITNPTIVNAFSASTTATTVTFNSVSTSVEQNITCIANRGEFGTSTNATFTYSDTPRISEIGLYDIEGDLIAIAKTDRHLVKNINEFLALGVKISV